MYLKIIETGEKTDNPNKETIAKAVISSHGGPCTGVILNKNKRSYMQTTCEPDKGYALEYLNEDDGILFHCHWLRTVDVLGAMQAYAKGCHCWQIWFNWEYWGAITP